MNMTISQLTREWGMALAARLWFCHIYRERIEASGQVRITLMSVRDHLSAQGLFQNVLPLFLSTRLYPFHPVPSGAVTLQSFSYNLLSDLPEYDSGGYIPNGKELALEAFLPSPKREHLTSCL